MYVLNKSIIFKSFSDETIHLHTIKNSGVSEFIILWNYHNKCFNVVTSNSKRTRTYSFKTWNDVFRYFGKINTYNNLYEFTTYVEYFYNEQIAKQI